ncbi:MAG: NupC/NupG family nucleoside CNT transporter [Phycisphaerales bacterium JB037]
MDALVGLLGVFALLLIAAAMSENRGRLPWRLIGTGILFQIVLAWLLIRQPAVVQVFAWIARIVDGVILKADKGIEFVFGSQLVDPSGPWGFIFAVKVLPVIIFFASLMAVLYHIGVMPRLVAALAWLLRRTLGVSGTEALAMASNVFVGQTEAPLCVRPYMDRMTRAQLATLMVGGFATIAGSVLAAYVGILAGDDAELRATYIRHLLAASVMSAPAAFIIARIVFPETDKPIDEGLHAAPEDSRATNMLDAAAEGASQGLRLALNVGAMLIAFVALLWLVNWPLQWLENAPIARGYLRQTGLVGPNGQDGFDLQTILGALFMPLAWLMGVPWHESGTFGTLLGEKLVLTEFVAYLHLGELIQGSAGGQSLSPRSAQIAAFALCGFANFASVAIQTGGLTELAPGRRKDFVTMGMRAMFGGALASWMTAAVASMFIA